MIESGDNALIFTDTELLFQINEKLSHEARISKSSMEIVDQQKYDAYVNNS